MRCGCTEELGESHGKKTNKEVLNKLGLKSTKLMTVVRQRIVRFYGHVRRHDSLQRIITEGMVNG